MKYAGYTAEELLEIRKLAVDRRRVGLRDELYGHGHYLSIRPDVSRTIEHIDELGQPRFTQPFQAVPFANAEDTAALATAYNALRPLIEHIQALEARVTELQADLASLQRKDGGIDSAQQAIHKQNRGRMILAIAAALDESHGPLCGGGIVQPSPFTCGSSNAAVEEYMSLASWKREFYRTPADKVKPEEALDHSIRKWDGLSAEALAKHGLKPHALWKFRILSDRQDKWVEIDSCTCALCQAHTIGCRIECSLCEVHKATGRNCQSQYLSFIRKGNPKPMQRLLARVKRWADRQAKKAGKA